MGEESVLLVQLQRGNGAWVDVGHLHSRDQKNWFEILESYWNLPDRPVLGQIFEEHGRAWRPNAHVALPHWFSHLLPEGHLRNAVAEASRITEEEPAMLRRFDHKTPAAVMLRNITDVTSRLLPQQ